MGERTAAGLDAGADVDWEPIAPQARTIWTAVAFAAAVPVLLVVVAALGLLVGPEGAAAGVALAVAVLVGLRAVVVRRHRAWSFAVHGDELLLRRGVLVRRLTVVPIGRMQFVDLSQGPLDRALGVGNVQLHTAAAATDASIPLLPLERASRLREGLLRRSAARTRGT